MNNAIAQMLSGRAPAQRPQQNAIGNAVPQQMKAAMPRPQMPRPQQMPGPQMPNMAQGMQNQMQPPTQPGKPQAVRGRDGQMYSIVIDPTTGLQTFSPYQGGM